MNGCRAVLAGALLLTAAFPTQGAAAEEPKSRPPQPPGLNQEAAQRSMEQSQKEMEKMQAQDMEQLKRSHPKQYEKIKANMDRGKKIAEIVAAFRKGSFSDDYARRQLYPLVEEQSQDEIRRLPEEIKRLKKRLEELESFESDHSLLVKKRLDVLLGKLMPTPEGIP